MFPPIPQAPDRYPYRGPGGMRYAFEAGERKRSAALAWAFDASTSRSRGGALVTREASNSCAALATWSTARLKASWFALEGRVKPLNLRTNCREEARISSSVAGGLKLCSVLMLRHMAILASPIPHQQPAADGPVMRNGRGRWHTIDAVIKPLARCRQVIASLAIFSPVIVKW